MSATSCVCSIDRWIEPSNSSSGSINHIETTQWSKSNCFCRMRWPNTSQLRLYHCIEQMSSIGLLDTRSRRTRKAKVKRQNNLSFSLTQVASITMDTFESSDYLGTLAFIREHRYKVKTRWFLSWLWGRLMQLSFIKFIFFQITHWSSIVERERGSAKREMRVIK